MSRIGDNSDVRTYEVMYILYVMDYIKKVSLKKCRHLKINKNI